MSSTKRFLRNKVHNYLYIVMVKQSSLDGLINQNSNGSFRTLLFVDGIIMTIELNMIIGLGKIQIIFFFLNHRHSDIYRQAW